MLGLTDGGKRITFRIPRTIALMGFPRDPAARKKTKPKFSKQSELARDWRHGPFRAPDSFSIFGKTFDCSGSSGARPFRRIQGARRAKGNRCGLPPQAGNAVAVRPIAPLRPERFGRGRAGMPIADSLALAGRKISKPCLSEGEGGLSAAFIRRTFSRPRLSPFGQPRRS